MSKHWNPPRQTIAVKPSRIRREPIRVEQKPRVVYSDEREIAVGVVGILLFAVALVVVIVGISIFTIFKPDPAAQAAKFGQCYNSDGQNCVIDGDTLYVGGSRVEVAGIEAPQINGARCPEERDRGIAAAVALSDLLAGGNVTVSPPFRDEYGRTVRSVAVKGRDVGQKMIGQSLVRPYTGEPQKWCS